MGIHPSDRHLAVIYFAAADGSPQFFVANSLMFGSTAAVYSFNRVSRSLWWLFNRMLLIPCGVFYDDFPLFSPSELAEDADFSASSLLDLLGWKHARTGPKGLPFDMQFQVLEFSLDLSGIPHREIVTANKPGRIERLQTQLASIRSAGSMSLYLSVHLFAYLFVDLSVHLSFYPAIDLGICLPFYLSTYPSVYLSICLSIYLSIYPAIYLAICLPIHLSIFLSVYLSIRFSLSISYLSVYLSICLSIWLFSTCLSIQLSI